MVDSIANTEPHPHNRPLHDIRLLMFYYSGHIHDRIQREADMAKSSLCRMVLLCNLYDAISREQHRLYLEHMRADNIATHLVSVSQAPVRNEDLQVSKTLSTTLDNIHINF